jgi:hypothetical protein
MGLHARISFHISVTSSVNRSSVVQDDMDAAFEIADRVLVMHNCAWPPKAIAGKFVLTGKSL